jgi:tetratricopeptide (TPR) repeat protein
MSNFHNELAVNHIKIKTMNKITLNFFLLFFVLIVCCSKNGYAQNAKRFYEDGVAAATESQWNEALDYFNKAIAVKSNYPDAYRSRGRVFIALKRYKEAISDFNKAISDSPSDEELYYFMGTAQLSGGMYKEATESAQKAIDQKKKYKDAYLLLGNARLCLKQYDLAMQAAEKAIDLDDDMPEAYLLKATIADSSGNGIMAGTFANKAVSLLTSSKEFINQADKKSYLNYFQFQIRTLNKYGMFTELLAASEAAMNIYKDEALFYAMKGVALSSTGNNVLAIENLNKAITMDERNPQYYVYRGNHFYKIGQTDPAIGDFQRSLVFDPDNQEAILGRARCLDALGKSEEALVQIKKIRSRNESVIKLESVIRKKIFEKNREKNPPEVQLASASKNNPGTVYLDKDSSALILKGNITDRNPIQKLIVNGISVTIDTTAINPGFSIRLAPAPQGSFDILASDVYGNLATKKYSILRSESNPPQITLLSPANSGKDIMLNDTIGYSLNLSLTIQDASEITRLEINGQSVSFDATARPVSCNHTLDIVGIDSVRIKATDIFNNIGAVAFKLNRSQMSDSSASPMGKTWAVFIDNSNYQNLPALQASSNDVNAMKAALSGYNINQIIVKKDLSKNEMERFFASDLREMVNKNNVNSILIWFAGHGKFLNETGYWLPVDANKKDDFTFFSLNNLRGYLASYLKVKHTLVVSDACETGPAFYLAMRDIGKPRECGNWETTRLRSAQVFSSTNLDLNDDKSAFAKSFVNILNGVNDKCISIDKVSEKVSQLAKSSQSVKPKLGNIQGLKDENGTFYFIRK